MPLAPGSRLGPYELLAPIGAGAMGEVWRARDPRLAREVAIKVLPATFAGDPERRHRFQTEARAAGSLSHPNIVTVFDAGVADGVPYVVEELLEGETLRQLLAHGPLATRRVLDISAQVARGLAAAHEHGVVHRDLKPDNLFVTRDGRARILDFGLAKVSPGTSPPASGDSLTVEITQAGMLLGTAGYMAPEQVRGEPADPRSDLFAFGVILHEMLGGKRPFARGTPVETLHAILHDEAPELPAAPPALARIVSRCLEKEPARRYQNALDLAFALESLSDPSGISGATAGAALASSAPRRRPRLGAAVALLAVLAAAAGGWWLARSHEPVAVSFHRLTFRTGTIVGRPRIAPEGRSAVYSATWDGRPVETYQVPFDFPASRSLGFTDRAAQAISPAGELALVHIPNFQTSVVGFGDLERVALSGGSPRALADSAYEADIGPDGTTFAVIRQRPDRIALEYPLGHEIYSSQTGIGWARVSPDGRSVAMFEFPVPGDDRGHVLLVDHSGHARVLTHDFGSASGLTWSADGGTLWFTAEDAGVHRALWSVRPGRRERLRLSAPTGLVLVDIAADGDALIERETLRLTILGRLAGDSAARDLSWFDFSVTDDIARDGSAILFDEENESAGPYYAACMRRASDPAPVRLGEGIPIELSPDGRWVFSLVPSTPQRAVLLPTGVGQPRVLNLGHIAKVGTAGSWMPDGRHLLVSANEAGHRSRLWLLAADGGPPQPVSAEGFYLGQRANRRVSPDGKRVLCVNAAGKPEILELTSGHSLGLKDLPAGWWVLRWHTDGTHVLVCDRVSNPAVVWLWDAVTGAHRKVLEAPRAPAETMMRLHVSDDLRSYAYSTNALLHDLYLMKGLR